MLSQTINLRLSRLKEFADHNIKLDESGSKFSKWVENAAGKGDIACYRKDEKLVLSIFSFFPHCSQKSFPSVVIVQLKINQKIKHLLCQPVYHFNSLSDDKVLALSKLKPFADDNITQMVEFLYNGLKNSIFFFSNYVFRRLFPKGIKTVR